MDLGGAWEGWAGTVFLQQGLGVRPPDPIRPPRRLVGGRGKWWSTLTLSLVSTPGDPLTPVIVSAPLASWSPLWFWLSRTGGRGRARGAEAMTNEGNRLGPGG